jgi:hypothetical protein
MLLGCFGYNATTQFQFQLRHFLANFPHNYKGEDFSEQKHQQED